MNKRMNEFVYLLINNIQYKQYADGKYMLTGHQGENGRH